MENYMTHSEVVQVTKMDETCSNMPEKFKGIVGEPNKWLVHYRGAIRPVFMTDAEFHARKLSRLVNYKVQSGQEFKNIPVRINHKVEVVDAEGKVHVYYLVSHDFLKKIDEQEGRHKVQISSQENVIAEYEEADRCLIALNPDSIVETPLERAQTAAATIRNLDATGIDVGIYSGSITEPDNDAIINSYYKRRPDRVKLVEIDESRKNYTKEKLDGQRHFIKNNGRPELESNQIN